MAVSKAQQRAVNKYMAANYDRINLTLPKGQKQVLKDHTAARGESVNGFIGRVITEALSRDAAASEPGETLSVSPETLATARRAAEVTGEEVSEFVARAVDLQMQRDSAALRLGLDPRKKPADGGIE